MALPKALCDREQAKFTTDTSGDTCVRVCGDIDVTANPAATGPIKITGESVTDVSSAFPSAANQVGRAALSIRNISTTDSVFIVNSTGISKVAAGIDVWEIGPDETANYDFDDANKIILVAESGKTASISIQEIKS